MTEAAEPAGKSCVWCWLESHEGKGCMVSSYQTAPFPACGGDVGREREPSLEPLSHEGPHRAPWPPLRHWALGCGVCGCALAGVCRWSRLSACPRRQPHGCQLEAGVGAAQSQGQRSTGRMLRVYFVCVKLGTARDLVPPPSGLGCALRWRLPAEKKPRSSPLGPWNGVGGVS